MLSTDDNCLQSLLEGLQCNYDEVHQEVCLANQQFFSFESYASNYHLLIT